MTSLAYRQARDHVRSFSDESEQVMKAHKQAMECLDCEAFLQMGIDAFNWLIFADEMVRTHIHEHPKPDETNDVANRLYELFECWMKPVVVAKKLIGKHESRGFALDNVKEFEACVASAEAILRAAVGEKRILSTTLESILSEAVLEFERGETSEFV